MYLSLAMYPTPTILALTKISPSSFRKAVHKAGLWRVLSKKKRSASSIGRPLTMSTNAFLLG
jgi:hypothetical protein